MELSDYAGAIRHRAAELDISARPASAEPTSPDRQHDVMLALMDLGDAEAADGNTSSASRHYQDSLDIAQRMAMTDHSNFAQWERDKATLRGRAAAIREP
jgi:hypothetical protein